MNKNKLYELFENSLDLPDKQILEILSKFKKEDFQTMPIIFDLIAEKKLHVLENLYAKGIPFTYHDPSGANALHVACGIQGSFEIVKFFIEHNIFTNINKQTDEGETPFLLAIMYGHKNIVEFFINTLKPDLSLKTMYGETAFTLAQKSNDHMIRALLEKYSHQINHEGP